jgi:hypothetical protein
MSFVVCVELLMPESVGLSDECSLCGNLVAYEPYHVGRALATNLANNYVSEILALELMFVAKKILI